MENGKMFIYQVFTRLFGNDNDTNKINGTLEENGSGRLSAFTGKALTEIKKMGFTHIWYTGIIEHATQTDYAGYGIRRDHPAVVKGKAGSPYAIKDYYDIDPDLADNVESRMSEFEELVERTHRAGLKMIIDFVPNHVARQYRSDVKPEGVRDLGEDDDIHTTFQANNNFYYMPGQAFAPEFDLNVGGEPYTEFPAKVTGNDCFGAHPTRNDWYETVKLNYGIDFLNGGIRHFDPVPDTWNKMRDILMFWASKNVDGFRCDMAEMVPLEFWAWVIPLVKSKYKNIDFIAEVYDPWKYRDFIEYGKFDYLYDKVGLYDTLRDIVCGRKSAAEITSRWQAVEGIQSRMLNFLENHDEQRIASGFFAGNPWKALPAMIVTSAMNTNPVMVYFGQELGEKGMDAEGFSGKDGRTTIFDYWSVESIRNWRNQGKFDGKKLTEEQKELRGKYISLITLCNKENAIVHGIFYDLMYANYHNPRFDASRQYAFLRKYEDEILLIVVNFDDREVDVEVFIPPHVFEYMQIEPAKIGSGTDLFTKEKTNSLPGGDSGINIHLNSFDGKILKFVVKK